MTEALRTEAMDAASDANFELDALDPRSRRMGDSDEEFESDDYADESDEDRAE